MDLDIADYIEWVNSVTNVNRESYCKLFCAYRKKHRCSKHGCRITNAPCDPIAEYLKQKDGSNE